MILTRRGEMARKGLLPAGCAEIAIDSDAYRAAVAMDADLTRPPSLPEGTVALALLHIRDHRATEGRDAQPGQPDGDELFLCRGC